MKRCLLACATSSLAMLDATASSVGASVLSPVYGLNEAVEGHTYEYWNAKWAQFEWQAGGAASPLLHPQGCRHTVIGGVVFLPGPLEGQTIACDLRGGLSVLVPTASALAVQTTAKDTPARLRRSVRLALAQTRVVDVAIDGARIDARATATTTGFFRLRTAQGSPTGARPGSHLAIHSGYNLILRPPMTGAHTIVVHVKVATGGRTAYEAQTTFRLTIA